MHTLFGLNRLVQAFGETPTVHRTACKFIDQHDLVIFDHVIAVAQEHFVGAEGLIDMVDNRDAARIVERAALWENAHFKQQFLRNLVPLFR